MRYRVIELSTGSWNIEDTLHEQYRMPKLAVSMHMRQYQATQVAAILNAEWEHFLAHPS